MGALFLLVVDVAKEALKRVIGTKIILLLIKAAFHHEGGLWKLFGYEVCGKAKP